MSKVDKKIQALQNASQAKRQNTLAKVKVTLRLMKDKNMPINFSSVAKLASVSKTWLYRQSEFKADIENARNNTGKIQRLIDVSNTIKNSQSKIKELQVKNKTLAQTIKKLRQQLELVYGELYKIRNEENS